MTKDTAAHAALSAVDFCKSQFERYLDSLGFTSNVRWIEGEGQGGPAYYLELDGRKYAVEVTTLTDQSNSTQGSTQLAQQQTAVMPRVAGPLWDFWGNADSHAGKRKLLQLATLLHLNKPLGNLRKYKARAKAVLALLNDQLSEKRDKLRNVSLPKIVLVYDAYRTLGREVVGSSVNHMSSLSSFQMVFITNWNRESFVVYP